MCAGTLIALLCVVTRCVRPSAGTPIALLCVVTRCVRPSDTNGDFDALDSAITAYDQRLTSQNLTMPEQFLVGVIYQWLHEFASE